MTCPECPHYRTDAEGYPWCARSGSWLGIRDKASYCAYIAEVKG